MAHSRLCCRQSTLRHVLLQINGGGKKGVRNGSSDDDAVLVAVPFGSSTIEADGCSGHRAACVAPQSCHGALAPELPPVRLTLFAATQW